MDGGDSNKNVKKATALINMTAILFVLQTFGYISQPRPHPFFKGKALGTRLVHFAAVVFGYIEEYTPAGQNGSVHANLSMRFR